MPGAYHSKLSSVPAAEACSCALLPLRTRKRGPAPRSPEGEEDIIDEILHYYRANVLFSRFKLEGGADHTLVYGTLYTSQLLKDLQRVARAEEAASVVRTVGLRPVTAPGEEGWSIGPVMTPARDRQEADAFKAYFTQLRQELGERLLERLYLPDGSKNKWWAMFSRRKFMGIELTDERRR